jgi:hypothetical protein
MESARAKGAPPPLPHPQSALLPILRESACAVCSKLDPREMENRRNHALCQPRTRPQTGLRLFYFAFRMMHRLAAQCLHM